MDDGTASGVPHIIICRTFEKSSVARWHAEHFQHRTGAAAEGELRAELAAEVTDELESKGVELAQV